MSISVEHKINNCYAKLVEAIVLSAMSPIVFEPEFFRKRWFGKMKTVRNPNYLTLLKEAKRRNRNFASSKLVGFYADAFGYDEKRVSEAIIKNNR